MDEYSPTETQKTLHDPDNGAAVPRKVLHGGDHIRSVEERLRMSGEEHIETHKPR